MLSSASSSFLVDEGHQSQNSAFSRLVVLFTFFLLTTWNVRLEFSHLTSGLVHTTSFLKERAREHLSGRSAGSKFRQSHIQVLKLKFTSCIT